MSWGHAIYLSSSALYTDGCAHNTGSGEKEIIVLKALIGDSYDYGTERKRELRVPPVKMGLQQSIVNVKYDSTSAITRNTIIYMIYENYRTYPLYIVRYKHIPST